MAGMRVDAVFTGCFSTFGTGEAETSAVAVLGGRIVATGAEAAALDTAEREDFGEAAIFPGFHDAHCHTTGFGVGLDELDLSSPPVSSLEDLYDAVRARSATSAPGQWVTGGGYDQNKIGGRHPERRRLDEATGGRPCWLRHTSGHMCVVNSAALALIGPGAGESITGGSVELGADGEPTGLLEERAQSLVQRLVLPRSLDELATGIGRAHDRYLSEGLTSVCDAGVAGGWIGQSPVELAAYQLARSRGLLRVRTTAMISADLLHPVAASAADGISQALDAGIRTGLGDEWLRVGPLKVFVDGSLIGRTCWMEQGFEDDPGNFGYPQATRGRSRRPSWPPTAPDGRWPRTPSGTPPSPSPSTATRRRSEQLRDRATGTASSIAASRATAPSGVSPVSV